MYINRCGRCNEQHNVLSMKRSFCIEKDFGIFYCSVYCCNYFFFGGVAGIVVLTIVSVALFLLYNIFSPARADECVMNVHSVGSHLSLPRYEFEDPGAFVPKTAAPVKLNKRHSVQTVTTKAVGPLKVVCEQIFSESEPPKPAVRLITFHDAGVSPAACFGSFFHFANGNAEFRNKRVCALYCHSNFHLGHGYFSICDLFCAV